jgi:hypothetical protein
MKGRGLAIYAAAAYLFLHLPLLVLTLFSFNSSRFTHWEGFSFKWYAALADDPRLIEATVNSLIIAVAATLLATVAGTLCAYGLWKKSAPVLEASLYTGLVTPEDRHWCLAPRAVPMAVPLFRYPARTAHGDPRACHVLHRLRNDRGTGTAQDHG